MIQEETCYDLFCKNAQVYEHVIKYDADVRFTEYRGSEKTTKKKCLKLLQTDEEMK